LLHGVSKKKLLATELRSQVKPSWHLKLAAVVL
jgi:hypothetical protein